MITEGESRTYSTHAVEDLTRDIRTLLDRNTEDERLEGLEDEDTLRLDELIKSRLEASAAAIEGIAPLHKLDGGESFGGSILWNVGDTERRHGYIELPSDFHRLLVFELGGWSRSVSSAITSEDRLYSLQGTEFAGIGGTSEKPIIAITHSATGAMLEFWGKGSGENVTISRARYLPYRRITEGGSLRFSPQLKEAIEHYAGHLTALALGDMELSERLKREAVEMATH